MSDLLQTLVSGEPLSPDHATELFNAMMSGELSPPQAGAALAMIQMRGPSVDEIVAAVSVMRDKVTPVLPPEGMTIIDTCGTGGDHSGTFNISTAAAIVAAAAGYDRGVGVAKHGNRSVTSKSGSSQVLETLGVNLAVNAPVLTQCLEDCGICFCFAPAHHPAMKHAAPIRKELGFRTIFNICGPLTNPAGATRQVMGVFDADLIQIIAEALSQLGTEHAMVVHGDIPGGGGLDEISTCGETQIADVRGEIIRRKSIDPGQLGLDYTHPGALRADGPDESAQIIREVFAGDDGPPREIVCLNAAAALVVADVAPGLAEGMEMAIDAIDSGKAKATLETLVKVTNASGAA